MSELLIMIMWHIDGNHKLVSWRFVVHGYTKVNNVVSEAEMTLCGVPQGSVLDHSYSYGTSMIFTSPLRYLPFIYLLTILV